MLTGFELHNCKAFSESGKMPLSPLTVLVGKNSAGKSSLLHALMVLSQSVADRAYSAKVPQLNLKGRLIDAGTFKEFIHGHDEQSEIGFSFSFRFDSLTPTRPRFFKPLADIDIPRVPDVQFMYPFFRQPRRAKRTQNIATPREIEVTMYFAPEPPFGPALSSLSISCTKLGKVDFKRTSGKERIQHWRCYASDLPRRAFKLISPGFSFFPILEVNQDVYKEVAPVIKKRINDFSQCSVLAFTELLAFLANLRMIGPFRTPPQRRFSFSGVGSLEVGLSGENAVNLLITERLVRPKSTTITNAVSFWLNHLGLAKRLKVRDIAKGTNVFELLFSGAGAEVKANFADVGFGVSQVLPVLVQGLLTPRKGTYIVQQPELHLHPDAQAGIADYFLYLASQEVNVIIETHSEYLLVRLRRRLAEKYRVPAIGLEKKPFRRKSVDQSQVSVVLLREAEGRSYLEEINIGPSFQFENMPSGFMNQSIEDRMALMKALRRK
ncbi:MAG: AAA family ATPase [bacterium]